MLRHIKDADRQKAEQSTTKNLLADEDDDDASDSEDDGGASLEIVPIWLILTTKKHIVDKNRLKPGKIHVPHSLCSSASLRICVITADPQRAVKDAVSDPSFPKSLSSRITKIIGFSKLKERYKSFESRRQLLAEHDVFLADDRIILRLVQALGKTFFKSTKRPIPIRIEEIQKVNGKRVAKDARKRPPPDQPSHAAVAAPDVVAREIERTLNAVPVHLAPAATAAVRVGLSTFTPDQLTENVEAVVAGMTEKYVTKGWRNIKAVHVKGPNTMALPIWLASELWMEEDNDGQENKNVEGAETKAIEGHDNKKGGKKRKPAGGGGGDEDKDVKSNKSSKKSKTTAGGDEDDDDADLIAARRQKLGDQKAKARSDAADDTVKVSSAPTDAASSKPSKKKGKSAA